MHRPPQRQPVAAAVAQLAGGLALIVGVPILLATLFGWPLPTEIPTWDTLTSTPLRFVDSTVILNAFVCAAWLCWTILTIYTALGIVDSLRGRPGRQHRIVPLAALAGKLTASVLLLASLTRPVTVAALPTPPLPVTATIDTASPLDDVRALHVGAAGLNGTEAPPGAAATVGGDPIYDVQRGDTLWDIAETQLGDPFRWPEIRDLNPQLLANPNLIRSGWQLTMPRDAATPALVEVAPVAPVDPVLPTVPDPPDAGATVPTPTTIADSPAVAPGFNTPDVGPASQIDSTPLALLASAAGVAGATVLATSLMVALRRRRRQSSAGPLRVSASTDLERALVATGDLPLVRWVGQELARLGELIAGQRREGVPVVVEFSEETGVEILWDQPVLNPPPPWTTAAGGWSWTLAYDPEQPVPVAERPSVVPALVTIGHRDGRQMMVNLEAFGTLAITGVPDQTEALLRAMLLELATGDEIAQARVVAVDSTLADANGGAFGFQSINAAEAAALIGAAVTEADGLLENVGCTTTFGYRTFSTPVLPVDVTVAGGSVDSDALVAAAQHLPAHRGGAVVLIGEHDGIDNRIVLAPDGTGTLEPLGIGFDPAALTAATGRSIQDLLEAASTPPGQCAAGPEAEDLDLSGELQPWWLDSEPSPATGGAGDADFSTGGRESVLPPGDVAIDDITSDEDDLPLDSVATPRIMVKVLGAPRLAGRPTIGRRELTVVAMVACSPWPVTHEQIQDAVWGASPITQKSVFNLIGKARTALGSINGQQVLSSASRPDNTITIHSEVGTDLALMRTLVEQAERSSSANAARLLTNALELVEGPPFDAAGYDWAITGQLVSEAEHLIEHAASAAAELALEAGDLVLARWAVLQGLRAIPGDETLYRLRMRIEDAAGNPGGVLRTFDELEGHLADYSLTPSPATQELLRELVGTSPSEHRPRSPASG